MGYRLTRFVFRADAVPVILCSARKEKASRKRGGCAGALLRLRSIRCPKLWFNVTGLAFSSTIQSENLSLTKFTPGALPGLRNLVRGWDDAILKTSYPSSKS